MLVGSFFFSPQKKITKQKKSTRQSCRASKWQFPLALTELPLVNTSGRVQFSSPVITPVVNVKTFLPVIVVVILQFNH